MAKSLVGIGPCFHLAASEVSVQAIVSRPDVSVVTSALFASMNIGGVVGTRYLPSLSEMLDDTGVIWRSALPRKLRHYLPDEPRY
ncbi:siderophore iron transporter mirA [Penicillium canescens]|nr:siderophore iron transporter mirA [Penicillium canescens]